MSRQRKNKKQSRQSRSRQSNSSFDLQMLEPRLLMSTTVMYQEGGTGSYTPTTFDDCQITQGSDASVNSWDAGVRNASGAHMYSPLAVKNLFTLLPATDVNGSTLSITSAQLILTTYQATTSDTLYVDRMTSNWLPNAAGSNETNVSYKHKLLLPTPTVWAGGGDISASDYTTTHEGSVLWAASNSTNTVDITALLKDIYSTGINDGFLISSSNISGGDFYYTSEYGTQASRPVLKITYDYIPAVTITATQPNAAEPSTTGTYTVTRTGTGSALTVNYTVTGTATNGTDYTSLTGSVTIPSGQASATITLTPINDNTVESTETAILTLAAGTGYTVGSPSAATVNIADNDSTVSITATQPNAAEPSTNGTFTVTRAGYTGAAVTVNYTATGTATNGTDYTSLTGAVTIASGQTTATITVAVIDDSLVEGTETAILTLTSGTDYTVGSPTNATVNITDNDTGSFGITGVSGTVNANQPITITGNVFGSGPDNVLFDNFDVGTVGTSINVGTGSTTVGSGWSCAQGWTSYSTDHVISGKQAFEGDLTKSGYANSVFYDLPAGTNQVYVSFCMRIPDQMPGWNASDDVNYKFLWLEGAGRSTAFDDTDLLFLGTNHDGSNSVVNSGNCLDPYGAQTWTGWGEGSAYNPGDWVRFTYSVTGSTTNGTRAISMLNLTTGVNYATTYTGRTWAGGSPDEWRSIAFDALNPRTGGTAAWFDDMYASTGANANARVEIGNASTYAACTNLSTCPTTSWASGSITANVNLGSLNPAGPLYLYVTKPDGTFWGTTSAGYAITASQAPAAINDSYTASSNGTLTTTAQTGVIANDVDLQGGTITATKLTNPAHGSVTFNSNGSFTYTPTSNYYGTDSFTYQDSDGTHTGNTGTVNIDVRQLMVKFGSSAANNTYGSVWTPQWQTVNKDTYMVNSTATDGIHTGLAGESYGPAAWASIGNTTAQTFSAGQTIYVTWYNNDTTLLPPNNLVITPQISFTDPDADGSGTSGTWYNMTPIDTINPGTSVTTSYTFTAGTAGSYKLINVCRNMSNIGNLMLSSIELD